MTTLDASYTVAELAREVGIKPYTVRYYERIGLVAAPSRPSGDHRRHDDFPVDVMRFIQGAQRLRLRLADIRELVELRRTGEWLSRHSDWPVTSRQEVVARGTRIASLGLVALMIGPLASAGCAAHTTSEPTGTLSVRVAMFGGPYINGNRGIHLSGGVRLPACLRRRRRRLSWAFTPVTWIPLNGKMALDNEPASGVTVTATDADGTKWTAITDDHGMATLTVPVGTYDVDSNYCGPRRHRRVSESAVSSVLIPCAVPEATSAGTARAKRGSSGRWLAPTNASNTAAPITNRRRSPKDHLQA